MDENLAISQFKRDFIIQTLVQETQFEQWLKFTFYLNHHLASEYDTIYQDSFYVKVYELLTEGVVYANEVYKHLQKSSNIEKKVWYEKLISGLNEIKLDLDESELNYIEYRRHSASHLFQNQYEYIQRESLKIKKERKGVKIENLNKQFQELIVKFGSDKNVDIHLNNKIQPKLTSIYEQLKK